MIHLSNRMEKTAGHRIEISKAEAVLGNGSLNSYSVNALPFALN